MGIGVSVFMITLGAILKFAVTFNDATIGSMTVDWDTVGVILMVLGVVGLIWSFMVMKAWQDRNRTRTDIAPPVDRVVERETRIDR